MFTTPVQDVVLTGKISKTLNYFNTTQEYFFRNIAFEAKLRNFARQGGIDFNSLKAVDIPEKMLAESAEHALRMTYAAMPKSNFGKEWVRAMTNPVITALVNPFPRFLWGNALPFLYRFSPIGFLEAARPSVIADIVGGNPAKFTKAISQATIGTTMLNMGFYVRNSKYAGERWYEIKVGDKRIDTRAFAPFSTYLFLAEAIQNPEKIKAADFGSALLSLNRIGGTGLVLADIMQSKDAATTISYLKRVGGAWLSGFTVPVKTFKDLYTAVDPKEAIIRDTKGNELFGPIQQNIPILSQKSPRAVTPLQTGDIRTETPLLRQFTGLSYRTKNALQKEVDTIQLPYNKIYPRTGDAKSDRMVSAVMANILEKAYPLLESKTNYLKMDEPTRRILLGQLFSDTKAQARLIIMKQYPEIGAKIKIDSIPGDIKSILQSRGILPQ